MPHQYNIGLPCTPPKSQICLTGSSGPLCTSSILWPLFLVPVFEFPSSWLYIVVPDLLLQNSSQTTYRIQTVELVPVTYLCWDWHEGVYLCDSFLLAQEIMTYHGWHWSEESAHISCTARSCPYSKSTKCHPWEHLIDTIRLCPL